MFYVRSKEQISCPCCSGKLKVIGSRQRVYIDGTGEKNIVIIRRLRCVDCDRIHHELPDILVPYKRHSSITIEAVIEENRDLSTPADESTIRRWKDWFKAMGNYFSGCLLSVAIHCGKEFVEEKTSRPLSKLQRIWQYVGDASGWLARLVRAVTNSNLFIHTRSAFLSE